MAYVYSDLDFFLDGSSARGAGIYLQKEPVMSPLEARVETFEIPGRQGALHIVDGTYKERTVTISCYVWAYNNTRDNGYYSGGDGVYSAISTATSFFFPSSSSTQGSIPVRRLKFGWNNAVYDAIVLNGVEVAARLKTLAPFDVVFSVSPFPS